VSAAVAGLRVAGICPKRPENTRGARKLRMLAEAMTVMMVMVMVMVMMVMVTV
jgi:hypothetical protein